MFRNTAIAKGTIHATTKSHDFNSGNHAGVYGNYQNLGSGAFSSKNSNLKHSETDFFTSRNSTPFGKFGLKHLNLNRRHKLHKPTVILVSGYQREHPSGLHHVHNIAPLSMIGPQYVKRESV